MVTIYDHFLSFSTQLHSQGLPVSNSLFVYNHLIFHMRTYLILSVSGNLCTIRDSTSQIILLKIKFHYLQPYDMTSQHPMLAHRYMYLILFPFESSCNTFTRMKNFISQTCFINMSSCSNPRICKIEFLMKPFAFLLVSESREDSIRKMSAPVSILIIE